MGASKPVPAGLAELFSKIFTPPRTSPEKERFREWETNPQNNI